MQTYIVLVTHQWQRLPPYPDTERRSVEVVVVANSEVDALAAVIEADVYDNIVSLSARSVWLLDDLIADVRRDQADQRRAAAREVVT